MSKCATETVTWTLPADTVAAVREVAAAYGVNDAVAAGALLILAQSISHATWAHFGHACGARARGGSGCGR